VFGSVKLNNYLINWYDPATNTWKTAIEHEKNWLPVHVTLIANQFLFVVINSLSVKMLDLSSQTSTWLPIENMLVNRRQFGVGLLNNCVYAVSFIIL